MKARTYLILMAVAILVPAALIMSAGLAMLLQWERDSRIRGVEEAARATVLVADRQIAVAEALLRGIVNSDALRNDDFAQLHREARAMDRDIPGTRTVLSDDVGVPMFNTMLPWGSPIPHQPARWVAGLYDRQKTHVSGYFIGPVTGRGTVAVDVPVPRAIGKRYIVSQVFDASYFERVFDGKSLGPGWLVTIFDANGISIARNHNAQAMVGRPVRPELYQASRRRPDGMLRHTTNDGVEVYSVYRRSPLSGWTVAIGVPVTEVEAAARAATLYAALSMLVLMGLAIGLAMFFAKRLSLALDQAQHAARALAADALPAPRPTRVREMDSLLADLRGSGEALARERSARAELEAERECLLRSEREARRQAEAQSRAKDSFLAMLGHELRNPLAAISGALTVIDMPGVKPELAEHARTISRRQVRHLTRIVDDLLDVRRILSGKVVLQKRRLDAGQVLRQCVEAKAVADAGAHAWTVDAPALWIEADDTRLGQIFDNLLHNAVKYTPAGGAIAVRARQEDGSALIEVSDTGIGIAADILPLIFDPLVQGPTGLDRAQGGLGLGLALVRELTLLHGGRVGAHSDGPGRGCTFTLRFPLALEAAPA